jgi:putative addiction module component (TIGR02574 family)
MAIPSKAEILELDVASRLELIDRRWQSIEGDPVAAAQLPISDAERALIDERLAEHHADPGAARPWSEVRRELLAKPR